MDIADNGGGAATESWREEWGEENQMNGDSTRTKKLQHYELAVSPTVQFTLQEFFLYTASLQNCSFQSPSLVSKSPSLVSKIFIISLLCV